MESVLRTRLRWPGNFIRFTSRHPCDQSASSGGSSSSSSSSDNDSDSYTEIPATTLNPTPLPNDGGSGKEDGGGAETVVVVIPEYMRRSRTQRPHHESSHKKKPSYDRRRRAAAAALSRESSAGYDSDGSYVELPATTLANKFDGSLAAPGGRKALMVEDAARGGVEIIPQGRQQQQQSSSSSSLDLSAASVSGDEGEHPARADDDDVQPPNGKQRSDHGPTVTEKKAVVERQKDAAPRKLKRMEHVTLSIDLNGCHDDEQL